ncbi:MAG: hypothetical protein NTY33_02900 [Candidatus Moranbacteria bacterium]|nr:hypothetical protein [Candidatus Moranbacteria bacterium]
MKIFWEKHKISTTIVIFIFVMVPSFYVATSFSIRKIQNKADAIQEKIIDGISEKAKIEKIPNMQEADAEFEKNKDSVGTILELNKEVDFIRYLESLAEETNNKIEIKVLADTQDNAVAKDVAKATAKKDSPSDGKNIEDQLLYKQYVTMQVDLTGDYDGFLNFEHKLENNKYYVNILSLNVQKIFVKKENPAAITAPVSYGTIFATTIIQGNNSNTSVNSDVNGVPMLKSSLNLIVYTQ